MTFLEEVVSKQRHGPQALICIFISSTWRFGSGYVRICTDVCKVAIKKHTQIVKCTLSPQKINIDRSMIDDPDRRCTPVSNYRSQVTSHKLEFQLPNTIYIYIYTSHTLRCNFPPKNGQGRFFWKKHLLKTKQQWWSRHAHCPKQPTMYPHLLRQRQRPFHGGWTFTGPLRGESLVKWLVGGLQFACDSYYKGVIKKKYKRKESKEPYIV